MSFRKLKNISFLGSANILGTAITAIFWFFIASEIEPEEFGSLHYFLSIAGLATYVALFGTVNTITVLSAKKIQLQSTLYLISLVIGAIATVVLIILFNRIDTGFLLFGYIISSLVIGELIGKQEFSKYFIYVLIQKFSSLILGISFYYLFGVEGILYALAISFSFYLIRIYKELKTHKIDFSLLKKNISFVSNNYFTYLAAGVNGTVDKLLIMPLLGPVVVGNYSLALQFFSIMLIFPDIIFKYILPHDAIDVKNKKIKQITIIISILLAFTVMFLGPIIIDMLFPKYVDAKDAIQILSVSVIPSTISSFYISKFLSAEKSRLVFFGTVLSSIILVVGILFFGPKFGIIGIAFVYTVAISGQTILFAILNRKYSIGGIF